MAKFYWKLEMLQLLLSEAKKGTTPEEIMDIINSRFGVRVTAKQVKNKIYRISTGRDVFKRKAIKMKSINLNKENIESFLEKVNENIGKPVDAVFPEELDGGDKVHTKRVKQLSPEDTARYEAERHELMYMEELELLRRMEKHLQFIVDELCSGGRNDNDEQKS